MLLGKGETGFIVMMCVTSLPCRTASSYAVDWFWRMILRTSSQFCEHTSCLNPRDAQLPAPSVATPGHLQFITTQSPQGIFSGTSATLTRPR